MSSEFNCPLCANNHAPFFTADNSREYYGCSICGLIFVPAKFHLTREAEKVEYDLHQNSPNDSGYRKFLSRLCDPVLARIAPECHGLDFGSGPGPTLSVMFEESGHQMSIYDPFYAPGDSVLDQQYDFVTASEVVEHLRNPADDMARLWACVKPGGRLGIMTKLALDREAFDRWHYKDDMTHVCFWSRETFEWIGQLWNAAATLIGSDVILFRKS